LVIGCAHRRNAQDLEGIYRSDAQQAELRGDSIIFVPGIEGSVLFDPADGRLYWGAWLGKAPNAARDPEALRKLAMPLELGKPLSQLEDELEAGPTMLDVQLGDNASGAHVRGYPGVFEGLMAQLQDPNAVLDRQRALPLISIRRGAVPIVQHGYDWRHDLSLEAANLHRTVLAAIERSDDPDRRVDIVAHSMGGLLVRWYLRYGDQPLPDDGSLPQITWSGAQYVRRALLVSTPNSGAAVILVGLIEGDRPTLGVPHYPAALLGTFPSIYQMLPRTSDGNVRDAESGDPIDVFDVRTWERFGWGLLDAEQSEVLADLLPEIHDPRQRRRVARDHLQKLLLRAKAFQAALDAPASPPDSLRVHLFIGDNFATPATLAVDARSGKRTWVGAEPGDGRITRRSALRDLRPLNSPGRLQSSVDWHSVHFANADHVGIMSDPGFLDDALYLLLDAPDPPPAQHL
jgi:hypothetical protein